MKKVFTLSLFAFIAKFGLAQAFTAGNIAVLRIGTGTGSLVNTGNAAFIDEYSPTGTLVRSIAMPTTVSGANKQLIISGTATSEGALSLSANGQYLVLAGYGRDLNGSGSISGTTGADVNRTLGLVKYDGTVDVTTALTDYASSNNARAATSVDGTSFWMVSGSGGVLTAAKGATGAGSTTVSTTIANIRCISVFNNQLYISTGSGTATRVVQIGTGVPTATGTTGTNLTGLPTSGSPYGFFFADINPAVPGVDVLYIADDAAGIQKFSLVGGTWTANGTAGTTTDAYRGITGVVTGTSVQLFLTRKGGSGATGGGELATLTDNSGYNATITGTPSLLATAAANTAFRGVALVPTNTIMPLSLKAFTGAVVEGAASLKWTTTNEVNVKGFAIEKSSNGKDFEQAGFVTATNKAENAYAFTAVLPSGATYFRLKMTDKDGAFKYSNTVLLNSKKSVKLEVYPNPAKDNVVFSHDKAGSNAVIRITDLQGRSIMNVPVAAGATQSSLNIQQLTTGNYIAVFENGANRSSVQVIRL